MHAIALRRRDVDVHVVEVNPAWDVYGVGIIQPGNALRATRTRSGSPGLLREAGFGFPGHQQFDRDGNVLAADGLPAAAGRARRRR